MKKRTRKQLIKLSRMQLVSLILMLQALVGPYHKHSATKSRRTKKQRAATRKLIAFNRKNRRRKK